jgi:hypothetical protein
LRCRYYRFVHPPSCSFLRCFHSLKVPSQINSIHSVVELAHDVCTTEPSYPENASPVVADFIKHCLLKSREARPQASQLLQVSGGTLC